MKLGDLLNKVKNSSNNQSVWNPKKRKMKKFGITEDDLLNIKIESRFKELLKD